MAIKIENVVTPSAEQWEAIIRGTRNPLNSWDKSDSVFNAGFSSNSFIAGDGDLSLMKRLVKAGTDHRKFMRMIVVYVDVTAPRYWWAEADTYKVGTVRNSCSTMHTIHKKEFTLDDFSHEHLFDNSLEILIDVIKILNYHRKAYLTYNDNFMHEKKDYWHQLIQLLPSSYNQRATLMLNYEVLANIYHSRKSHRLDEWRDFCAWIETLPYSELITGGESNGI